MQDPKARLRELVSHQVSIRDLMAKDAGRSLEGMILCPFHFDSNPSAKFYDDKDGVVRLFCFGCRKQYTSYDYILRRGLDPKDFVTDADQVFEKVEEREIDFSSLDDFRVGKIKIEDCLRRILDL